MALAVNQAEENDLNWADFIDGLRFGTLQRRAPKRGAQPAPDCSPPEGGAREARVPRIPPDSRPS
ncbi:MAG: hypothetical protein M0015_01670 [Betaproteobacteria bacterium]|nr:hypothetical protein [Betaproteobacteria bacterium]